MHGQLKCVGRSLQAIALLERKVVELLGKFGKTFGCTLTLEVELNRLAHILKATPLHRDKLDDMEAELRFNDIRNRPRLHCEDCGVKRPHHGATRKESEVPAFGSRPRVLGVFLCQFSK